MKYPYLLLSAFLCLSALVLATGCSNHVYAVRTETEKLADKIVSESCGDFCLVRITDERFEKCEYNEMLGITNVIHVIDGIVECRTPQSVSAGLIAGSAVRSTVLIDDVALTREILAKMGNMDKLRVAFSSRFAFFMETPPPEGCVNKPVAGMIESPDAFWIFSRFYDPACKIVASDIIDAYRRCAEAKTTNEKLNEADSCLSFVDKVSSCMQDDTNRVFYAGISNGFHIVYHETKQGLKEWRFHKFNINYVLYVHWRKEMDCLSWQRCHVNLQKNRV